MVIKPPVPTEHLSRRRYSPIVFLAGSIEQGKAALWQDDVILAAGESTPENTEVLYLNPRRDEWDPTWVQSINNPDFNYQVNWEMDGIEMADIVFFYFQPDTLAPVTMLELGEALASGKRCIVVCPEGYWRKGNVDIACHRRGVTVYETLTEGIAALEDAFIGDWD